MSYSINHHQRLNPKKDGTFGTKKPFKGKNKNRKGNTKITKEDLDYLNWLHNVNSFSCLVCNNHIVEWHHVKRDSTCRKNHKRLIPLCQKHHTVSLDFSAHGTPKKWRETYSMGFQNDLADMIYRKYLDEK